MAMKSPELKRKSIAIRQEINNIRYENKRKLQKKAERNHKEIKWKVARNRKENKRKLRKS